MLSEVSRREGQRKRIVPIKALLGIATAVRECPGDQKSFEEILKLANRLIDYRSACLFLVEGDGGRLEEYARVGEQTDLISFVRFSRGEGFSAWVAKQRRPILIKGTGRARSVPDKNIKSFMSVPIFCGQELVGVVNMSHEEAGAFDQADLELLQLISSLLTGAIQRFYLQRKLGDKEGEIQSLERTRGELEAKIRDAGGVEQLSQLISEVERGTAQTLASIAGNTQFLRLALEGGEPKLLRSVGEIEKGISELENLNYRLRSIQKPAPRKMALLRAGEVNTERA
jgi:GAF domain-containing protein